MNSHTRKPTSLSLDAKLLTRAKALKVNLSRAAEDGVREAVAVAKAKQWKAENAAAIQSSNEYVERHGLPLARALSAWRRVSAVHMPLTSRVSEAVVSRATLNKDHVGVCVPKWLNFDWLRNSLI